MFSTWKLYTLINLQMAIKTINMVTHALQEKLHTIGIDVTMLD